MPTKLRILRGQNEFSRKRKRAGYTKNIFYYIMAITEWIFTSSRNNCNKVGDYIMKEGDLSGGAATASSADEKVIHVVSLDFDDCLFFKGKAEVDGERKSVKQVLAYLFGKLLDQLSAEMVFDGSSRQNKWAELQNIGKGGGASFGRFATFMEGYNERRQSEGRDEVVFVKALMEDLWRSLAPGTTFESVAKWVAAKKIEERLDDDEIDDDAILDLIDAEKGGRYACVPSFRSKIAMVYWQMCQARDRCPEGKVVFHFCDNSTKILGGLEKFYQEHRNLIPTGVTLQLHHTGDTQKIEAEMTRDKAVNLLDGCEPYDPIISTNSRGPIDPVDRKINIRIALKYASKFTDGPDSATLDGQGHRFGEAIGIMNMPMTTEDPLCAVVLDYEVERAKKGRAESHRTRGLGYTYAEKIEACGVFKFHSIMQTKESLALLEAYIDTLSDGQLGWSIVSRIQQPQSEVKKRPLFAPSSERNKKVIITWFAKQSDKLPQQSTSAAVAEPEGGGAKAGP